MPGGGAREGTGQRGKTAGGIRHQDRELSSRPRKKGRVLGRSANETGGHRGAARALSERRNLRPAIRSRVSQTGHSRNDLHFFGRRREAVSGLLSVARVEAPASGPVRQPR